MADYLGISGTIKKLYLPNSLILESGKRFSQYGGLPAGLKIGDIVEFKFTEKEQGGVVYNNIAAGSLKVTHPSVSEGANMNKGGNNVDWDAIAEGKIRSLLLQAHVTRNGLVPLTEMEKVVLKQLVDEAMGKEDDKN